MKDVVLYAAMERLASSSWGQQGVGACADPLTRLALLTRNLARPVRSQPEHVLALTLLGFRTLEAHRQQVALRRAIHAPKRIARAA